MSLIHTLQVFVPVSDFFKAIDFVFAGSKSFEREKIKTDIVDTLGVGGVNGVRQ